MPEKFHDSCGNLYYQVKNRDGQIFSVTKPSGTDPAYIVRESEYCRTNAMIIDDDGYFFWEEAPKSDSFIKVARWMKANVENLI